MRFGLPLLAISSILVCYLPLATAGSNSTPNTSDDQSNGTGVSASGSNDGKDTSVSNSREPSVESASNEEPDLLSRLETSVDRMTSALKKKKKKIMAVIDDESVEFDTVPEYIHTSRGELVTLLEESGLYLPLKMAEILAMSPKEFKKYLTERYESNVRVVNYENYVKEIKKHTATKDKLKSDIGNERKTHKERVITPNKAQAHHEESIEALKNDLTKVRKIIKSYDEKVQAYKLTNQCYESILKLPLKKIIGDKSVSALYKSCVDDQRALDRERRRYDSLRVHGKACSSSSEVEDAVRCVLCGEDVEGPDDAVEGPGDAVEGPADAVEGPADATESQNTNPYPLCGGCLYKVYKNNFSPGGVLRCPTCEENFKIAEAAKPKKMQKEEIRSMRGILHNPVLKNKHKVNGKPVAGKTSEAADLLQIARQRVKKNLLAFKGCPNYDKFFNNRTSKYLDFYIPRNLVKYLLKDQNPRTIGHYNHKAAFVRRARKCLESFDVDIHIRHMILPRLLDALYMLDFIMEYLYTPKLFDLNSDRERQKREIRNNKNLYPAIHSALVIGTGPEFVYLNSLDRVYEEIKHNLKHEIYDEEGYNFTTTTWIWSF